MNRIRVVALLLSVAGLGAILSVPAVADATARTLSPALIAIRAAHHPGYDRLVFEFRGGLPAQRSVHYVSKVIADPSGKVVPVPGSARLLVRFFAASAPGRLDRSTYALPGLIQVVNAGHFEAVLRYGVGVARKEPFRVFTLTHPSRVVIDLGTPYRTVPVRVWLTDTGSFAPGTGWKCVARSGFACAVSRPVIPPALAFGALQRLFAGPTASEGLVFFSSGATGFANLTIRDHVARVQLTGGCGNVGQGPAIDTEITPTLKQFRSVRWVKIYDPAGHTERPAGHSDSIPQCLEPPT